MQQTGRTFKQSNINRQNTNTLNSKVSPQINKKKTNNPIEKSSKEMKEAEAIHYIDLIH